MEFGNVGKHCAMPSCKQLDFLPFKCDACGKEFCLEHRTYEAHTCPIYRDPNVVDTCEVCELRINHGEKHICPGKKKKTNRCNKQGCKKVELIPIFCSKCKKQFCIQHRNELDHECKGQTKPVKKPPRPVSQPPKPNPQNNANSKPKPSQPIKSNSSSSSSTMIAVRLTNGEIIRQSFNSIDTLSSVITFIDNTRTDGKGNYSLKMTYPSKDLTKQDHNKTLSQLELVPSGTLIMKSEDSSSEVKTPSSNPTQPGTQQPGLMETVKGFVSSLFWPSN